MEHTVVPPAIIGAGEARRLRGLGEAGRRSREEICAVVAVQAGGMLKRITDIYSGFKYRRHRGRDVDGRTER
jgi:hypothetical protein